MSSISMDLLVATSMRLSCLEVGMAAEKIKINPPVHSSVLWEYHPAHLGRFSNPIEKSLDSSQKKQDKGNC